MVKKCHFGLQRITKKSELITFSLKLAFLQFLAKFKQKREQKSKNMAEKGVFGPKRHHFCTKKMTKIGFSLKLHLLHFLAKFKQKSVKIQKYDRKRCFWLKKDHFCTLIKRPKGPKSPFLSNLFFYTFQPNLSKKYSENPKM